MKPAAKLTVTVGLAALTTLAASAANNPQSPNIVLILVDDMGYGDIQPFGSVKNRTPNLNRMAVEGLKMTSFYTSPVCTPSRAQFMTGCYAKRVSLPSVIGPMSPIGISPKEHTVAQLLKKQGYATMIVGKWHLGDQPAFLPMQHGFDGYFGLPYSNDMDNAANPKAKNKTRPPLPLVRNDKPVEVITPDAQHFLEQRYTDVALQFIRDHADAAKNGNPFFLYLAHTAVHFPIKPGPDFQGKSANGRYGDWVEEVDWSTGRVLDTLRELALADNTLVIFTSDNGPWLIKGADAGTAAPLRGGKGGTFEGGVREPFIAWWPGKVPANLTIDTPAASIDILPTLVALAGGAIPTDNKIDGADISPILLGKTTQTTRTVNYYFAPGGELQAVRQGPWKLAIVSQDERRPGVKFVADPNFKPTLYNLDTDIAEQHDLAAAHPEIVNQLQSLIADMDKDLGIKNKGPGVRAPGQVAHPVGLWLPGHEPTKETIREHYDTDETE